jgi:hypothetical protein
VRRAIPLLALAGLPACSQSATKIAIDVTAGQETTAFTDAQVHSCGITVKSLDGTVDSTVNAGPGQTFDFSGDISSIEQVNVSVSCTDAGGTKVMAGQALSGLLLGAVTSAIPVFVQQIEQWARPSGSLVCGHVGGIATVGAERFLMLTGGTKATGDTSSCDMSLVDGYDIFSLDGDNPTSLFSPVPDTVVSLGSQVVTITGKNAWLIDLSGATQENELTAPAPLTSFADVAGGAVVLGTTSSYVVGPTRGTQYGPSQFVLQISSDGQTLTGYQLSAPRQGAAATWVQNQSGTGFAGLVIAGGNSAAGVAGIELIAASTTAATSTTLPYPPDGISGAGAVYDFAAFDGADGIFLFGGTDGATPGATRHLSLTCNPCTVTPIDTTGLPALTGVSAYHLPSGKELVLGTEVASTGMYRSFLVQVSQTMVGVTEAPFREPRSGATPFPAPNGTLSVMGGQHADGSPALSIELFQP